MLCVKVIDDMCVTEFLKRFRYFILNYLFFDFWAKVLRIYVVFGVDFYKCLHYV